MKIFKARFLNNRGTAAVEFAILLPIWFMIFFGLLDYSWYLTNVMIMENAVSSGARAGVKVKYWLDSDDEEYEDPEQIAINAVNQGFWLDDSLDGSGVEVSFKGAGNSSLDDYESCKYLEVRVVDYEYTPLTGYLPEGMIPRTISAVSLMAFP